ncbi:MAG TPA: DUF6596 domain-containing protein [Stackebrandtia sp.]|jgi:RNA polymerase sigma factor (sigma-70 family)|uniref:RNA polymerase sigma factor n=1 Tax=Stackebrandtia sp. TaxID=2023065 RepID=UPI002D5CFA35|nr:DUF6596 domain-containing protein [Stackebrandtia sp.]HZE40298.1 DUF6596 domain-containing protein [Stackebrandtia sp.]
MGRTDVEHLLRREAPRVLGAVVRRYGHFDLAEDAVQEALLAASTQWTDGAIPDNPRAWLIAVAARRLTDLLRAEQARRRREDAVARWVLPEQKTAPAADRPRQGDDTLVLLFLCCHPSLTTAAQIALTLRAVGGLNTREIARAFLVPVDTMTRRISRAKKSIKDSRLPFRLPDDGELADRVDAVLRVLYLIFNEGYVATAGPGLQRADLAAEAIRLARVVHGLRPDDAEAAGLLALMLLTDARRAARTGADGELIPMADQDRGAWNRELIDEGIGLLARDPRAPYQLQAAIAAAHDTAPSVEDTDWPRIEALYARMLALQDNPVVRLNHAVAVAMARGPRAGLDLIDGLSRDTRMDRDPRLPAARAHLLEMDGEFDEARAEYLRAAELSTNRAQQRYVRRRAARLRPG